MGNSTSTGSVPGARFLAGCPQIPLCPDETEVQTEFHGLLRRKLVTAAALDELNSIESTDTKWMYICLDKFLATPEAADTELLDPHVCVQEILDPQFQLDGLHDLFRAVRINMVLRSKEWIERFVREDGVNSLVSLLDPAKAVSELVHVEALNTLFALSTSSEGLSAMVKSANCCDGLLDLYTTSSSNVQRGRVLKLLGILCCHSQAAQSIVMASISRRSTTDATKTGTSKFGLLASSFLASEGDRPFQLAVVTFVNTIVNTTLDTSERVAIRDDLEKLGFITALEQCGNNGAEHAISMQIQVFMKSHANDRAKMPTVQGTVQRRLSLNIPAAADEPVFSPVPVDATPASVTEATATSDVDAAQSTPQREGPKSLQTRKSLRLEMTELHTETEEVTGRPLISPPPAPDPVQRRPSGSLLPSLSIPKVSVAFSATKAFDSVNKTSQSTVEVCLPTPQPAAKETSVPSETKTAPSLESILTMLQQGTKSLDEQTSQKLLGVLSKLASSITAEGSSATCGKVVERLEQSLAAPSRLSPAASPVMPNRLSLRLPTRYSDSDVYALAAGTPAKAHGGGHHSRFPSDEAAAASGDHASRSPVHSHYEEEHSPRRSMTETESYDESCHEYETKARSKPSGAKVALAGFFQHLKKGQGLPTTPAPTPMATASVKKDARRPVFPSFGTISAAPSPMPMGHVGSFALPPLTPLKPSISLSLPPLTPVRPHIVPTTSTSMAMLLSPRAPKKEEHLEAVKEEESEPPSPAGQVTASNGPDIAKFRKLLAMGAPRAAVRAKMQQAGVDPDLLDRPDTLAKVDSVQAPTPVGKPETAETTPSGPDISKFRKLLVMGAPLAAVKAKMQQAGLDPALLDQPVSPPVAAATPSSEMASVKVEEPQTTVAAPTKIKDDPTYAKFFKLRAMGAPAEAVKAKMRQAGVNPDYLDTPDADMPSATVSSPPTATTPEAPPATAVRVRDDPEYAKFFKLLSMGAPAAAVKAKMQQAGVNPDLLDTPDAVLPANGNGNNNAEDGKPVTEAPKKVLVKDHPDYAKFFKLKTMAPVEVVKAKMRQSGLDPDLLDTPDAEMPTKGGPETPEGSAAPSKLGGALSGLFANRQNASDSSSNQVAASQPTVLVKDDPAYAKFFKLVAMGAPADTVKGKMQMAGLRPELLDTPDAPLNPTAPAAGSNNQTSNNAAVAPTAPPTRRGNLTLSIKPPSSKPTTRPLYWQHLKGESIRGTIWEEIEKEQSKENNELPLFLADSDLGLLEQEFPAQTAPMTGPGKPTRSLSMDQMPKELMSPRVVFLIDRSRANNISIIIKQFRMSHSAIREAAMKVDANVLTLERVQGLIKILPTDEEVAAITGYQGDPMSLNEAERILKELITVPRLKQRLTAMQARLQFPQFVRDLQQKVDKLRAACTEVGSSCEFKTILQVVLQVGNRLNQGTPRGGAKGFRLGDLPKLSQLKAADKTSTLLHYVARMIRQKKGNAVRLSESLSSLYDVQNIPIPELPADMNKVVEIVDYVTNEVGAQRLKNTIEEKEACDHFVKVMGEFLDTAATATSSLKADLDAMIRLLKDTMQRFGFQGDSDSSEVVAPAGGAESSSNHAALASAGEFFMTIYEFSVGLTKADRENEVKRLREEARARATMKPKTPALGPRSMSSRDMMRKSSVVERKTTETATSAGPETPESNKAKDKITGSPNGGTRTSPMLRQRSASLSSIVENNINIEAILSALPAKSPSSSSSTEKPVTSASPASSSASAGSVEKKASFGSDATKQKTPESKPSSIKPPTKFTKPSASSSSSSDKDKSVAKPKPAVPLPGKIVKSSPTPAAGHAPPLKVDYSVCYKSPLGLTMPASLEKPKTKEKPEFEEVTPFDMASIEDIRAQLVKKHVTADSNNNGSDTASSTSSTSSKALSHTSPEETAVELDLYAEAFEDDA